MSILKWVARKIGYFDGIKTALWILVRYGEDELMHFNDLMEMYGYSSAKRMFKREH